MLSFNLLLPYQLALHSDNSDKYKSKVKVLSKIVKDIFFPKVLKLDFQVLPPLALAMGLHLAANSVWEMYNTVQVAV